MQAPAHPDDETNALFALYGYGQGLRVIDVQNNRGEGGQNEIGPELFRDMGVLRTSELLAAHRIDGAEQYFTRAIDYGYSFDPNEVIQKWGRDEIVGDYVRLFRTLRPDVIVTMNIQGGGGDRAHEATTILVREAYRAAGDPTKYPEQMRDGLRPWQPSKLYFAGSGHRRRRRTRRAAAALRRPRAGAMSRRVDIDRSTTRCSAAPTPEIGADARSNHKCQGMGGVPPLPGRRRWPRRRAAARRRRGAPGGGRARRRGGRAAGRRTRWSTRRLPAQMDKDETSLFDGVDMTLAGLAKYAGRESAGGAHERRSRRSRRQASGAARRSTPATTRARRRRSRRV